MVLPTRPGRPHALVPGTLALRRAAGFSLRRNVPSVKEVMSFMAKKNPTTPSTPAKQPAPTTPNKKK